MSKFVTTENLGLVYRALQEKMPSKAKPDDDGFVALSFKVSPVKYVAGKTGYNENQVRQLMRELRKQGAYLPRNIGGGEFDWLLKPGLQFTPSNSPGSAPADPGEAAKTGVAEIRSALDAAASEIATLRQQNDELRTQNQESYLKIKELNGKIEVLEAQLSDYALLEIPPELKALTTK